jgi:hypothetical protein
MHPKHAYRMMQHECARTKNLHWEIGRHPQGRITMTAYLDTGSLLCVEHDEIMAIMTDGDFKASILVEPWSDSHILLSATGDTPQQAIEQLYWLHHDELINVHCEPWNNR